MIKVAIILAVACGLTLPAEPGPAAETLGQMANGQQLSGSSKVKEQQSNRLLVRFEDQLSSAQIETIVKRLGLKIINTMSGGKLVLVEVPYEGALSDIRTALEATSGVQYAEPEQIYKTQEQSEATDADGQSAPAPGAPSIQKKGE